MLKPLLIDICCRLIYSMWLLFIECHWSMDIVKVVSCGPQECVLWILLWNINQWLLFTFKLPSELNSTLLLSCHVHGIFPHCALKEIRFRCFESLIEFLNFVPLS